MNSKTWVAGVTFVWAGIATTLFGAELLPISAAVQKALDYSPYIKAMVTGEQVAREKIGEARAMHKPQINIGVTDSRLDSPMMAFGAKLNQGRIAQSDFSPAQLNDPQYLNNLQSGIQIGYPVSLAGMDRHAIAAARNGVEASRFETTKAREDTIYKTIEMYLNAILARESVAVAEKAVEASGESVRNAQAAVEAQRAVNSDFLQAQVHHSQNEETLLRMKNQHRLALEGLATMMGIPSAADYDLDMPFLRQECTACQEEPAKLLEKALQQRPDYLKISKQAQALGHTAKMHKASTKPHFLVGAAAEHNQENLGGKGHSNSMVFARFDWKLADGGDAKHKAAGARLQQDQMGKMQEALADQIHLEIREAVTNINNALERIRVSREASEQGAESLRILRDRYSAGLAIMSDLLGAETSLLSHQMNHLKALYDYALSKARLKMALGELTPEHCEILRPGADGQPQPALPTKNLTSDVSPASDAAHSANPTTNEGASGSQEADSAAKPAITQP